MHATPVVAGDTVIVGAAHRSGGVPHSKTNAKGYVRGFDVKTGKRLWIFHTIPRPGEFGYNTWEKDSADYTGNAGVWGQISVDEELGLVYLPVELPTGDYYGGHRPGNGLFGESLVAVDLKTGQRKWHYQLVHHGIWDMDIPCAPILADITINGRTVKAVAQPTKQAFLYVFNRETGQPIWPIEEKPVEKGTVPGEWYSPTQPFPTKPPAYDRQGLQLDDLIDFTPALHAQAVKIASLYKLGPVFTPPVLSKIDGPLATLALATSGGGTNWPGGSYDPETHTVYVFSQRSMSVLGLVPGDPRITDEAYIQGTARTGARTAGGSGANAGADTKSANDVAAEAGGLTVQGLPLVKPPYASISAIDLNRGEILWQVAHGETPDNIRNHPALKGLTIPRTGRAGVIGTLVTKTLVIAGERDTFTAALGAKGSNAAGLRQGIRQGRRRRLHARRANRHADDLYAERKAVHRGRDRRNRLRGRVYRLPPARLAREGTLFTWSTSTSSVWPTRNPCMPSVWTLLFARRVTSLPLTQKITLSPWTWMDSVFDCFPSAPSFTIAALGVQSTTVVGDAPCQLEMKYSPAWRTRK